MESTFLLLHIDLTHCCDKEKCQNSSGSSGRASPGCVQQDQGRTPTPPRCPKGFAGSFSRNPCGPNSRHRKRNSAIMCEDRDPSFHSIGKLFIETNLFRSPTDSSRNRFHTYNNEGRPNPRYVTKARMCQFVVPFCLVLALSYRQDLGTKLDFQIWAYFFSLDKKSTPQSRLIF